MNFLVSPVRRRALIGSVAALLLLSVPGWAAGSLRGGTLAEALEHLREQGLPIVYSTTVVRQEMTVDSEPRSEELRAQLDEILEPHGLVAQAGPGERLLVVRDDSAADEPPARSGAVWGRVVDGSGRALVATVEVAGSDRTTTSDKRGRFELTAVAEGSRRVVATSSWGATLEHEVEIVADRKVELVFRFETPKEAIEEVDVVSHFSLLEDSTTAGLSLDRAEIAAMPHFGDDLNRAVSVLPGVAADDYTAGFNVRGDLDDEVLVRLDGLELFEPYHLKDFAGLFSIVDPRIMSGVDLVPGSFTAEYGDRSSSVLDMRTLSPTALRGEIGASFSGAWASGAGRFGRDQGSWLVSARRGYLDVLLDIAGEDEDGEESPDPEYWDLFGKLDWDLSAGHALVLHALAAGDSLDFFEQPDPTESSEVDTDFDDRYVWLAHRGVVGRRTFVDTVLSAGGLDHDREVFAIDRSSRVVEVAALSDLREVEFLGLRQDWTLELSDRNLLKAGFERRTFDVRFDYSADIVRQDPIDDPRFELPDGIQVRAFRGEFDSDPLAAWLSDRHSFGPVVVEVGARFDRYELVDRSEVSPRLNLLWTPSPIGVLRVGWGHFHQSQRAHELEVEFGETRHLPPQRAEHWSLGWERTIGSAMTLRVDAYRRDIVDPHPRYVTLFDPFKPVPQIAIDLIRLVPESARSQGVELTLRSGPRPRLGWWVSYVRSEVTEEIGGRDQRRSFDQPDALRASISYRFGRRWSIAGLWRYHTGWPTTAVTSSLDFEPGSDLGYQVGPFYAERLDDYHSLDLRISRSAEVGRGRLALFVDIQNLYDRRNPRGVDIEDVRSIDRVGDSLTVTFDRQYWLGLLPSFGMSWRF